MELVRQESLNVVRVLLACGHWSKRMDVGSDVFDSPDEAVFCRECRDVRQLAPALQVRLQEGRV